MKTAKKCCDMYTKSRSRMRRVSNYCVLIFLALNLAISNWCIQSVSAQPSGTLELVEPSTDASPDVDFVVSVEILNPQNVSVFDISIEYPTVFTWVGWSVGVVSGNNQFDVSRLTLGRSENLIGGRTSRLLKLGYNHDNLVSEGTLLTITFQTSEIGNHWVELVDPTYIQDTGSNVTDISGDALPRINVPVRGPMAGIVNIAPAPGINGTRLNETSFVDIELKNRTRAHSYEITVDPSNNLGSLTVSYNADDINVTEITNHTAGDPITLSGDLWLPNDPIDADNLHSTEWRVTHSDPIVATLFFTPTTAGEGSFAITAAKIFDSENTELTLANPDTLTFTVVGASNQVTPNNTGTRPKPVIIVEDGVKQGPFEVEIYFESKNHTEHVINDEASILWSHGVYGFARDEVMVNGAGASVTTRLWEADGAQIYYARINPTETGPLTVEISVPADVAYEVATNLPNVASEEVTVQVNLEYLPWDVNNDGLVTAEDAEIVEASLGQGLVENAPNFAFYRNTIITTYITDSMAEIEVYPDVNGDLYVNEEDLALVRMHITDDGGNQGRSEVRGQSEGFHRARGIGPPDASVWMPDENLRREMREKFNIRDDSELTQARMTHLTSLGLRSEQINDITGLEYAINLTEFVIRNTQISDLEPLRGLTGLSSLKLEDNNISDITALGGLTNLTLLNISGNGISDVTALGGLTNLTELWATDNNISDITALANLTNLRKLRLRDNPILDTSPLYFLTQGALQDVDITVHHWMPDVNLRKKMRKALSIAEGEDFTQVQLSTLTKLTANKARISNIKGLEHAVSLRKLDLRWNQINDVGWLRGLTNLTELKIGYNDISDISTLGGLTKLTHLGLAENKISDISALGNLRNLKELWLRDNNISDVTTLANLTKLTRLNLEENKISDISALGNLRNLIELWLWKNSISDIAALANLTKLTYLNIKENEISDISALSNLRNLRELWLRGNNVSDVTALGSLTKLTHISLRENELSDISALSNLRNLRELWLQENNISNVSPLSSLTKLKKLGLSDNPILDTSPLYSLTQGALNNVDITVSQYPPWDVNEDGNVDATDSALVTAALGQTGNAIVNARTDVNGDDTVDQNDLTLVTANMDTDGGAPSSVNVFALMDPETLKNLDRSVLDGYLNTLRAESDGSLKYERAIAILEALLVRIRPDQTQLLANYPNPFNPETWIPYQLANASNVQIIIYDTTGEVVRHLDLGHQPEGYYTSKVRAVYWDGRNGFGERVASGIYFYQLQADNMSLLRKLLILK